MARRQTTVADIGWSFLNGMHRAGAPENTYRVYRSNLMALLDELGSRPITSVTPPDLARFRDAGDSEASRDMRRRIANHVMRHAYREGAIKAPVAVPEASYKPRKQQNVEWTRYSAEQLRQLIERAPCARSRMAIAIGVYTAMRVEDIRLLRAPSPDIVEGWLAAFIHKTRVYDFKVISSGLEDEFRLYLPWLYSRGIALKSSDYLIPGYPSGVRDEGYLDAVDLEKPISKWGIYARYEEARDAAGLPYKKQEKWHAIRRSSARLFFEMASDRGYDAALRMTQAFLNHRSIQTTERYIGLDSAYAMRDQFLRDHDLLGYRAENVVPLTREGRDGGTALAPAKNI